MGGTGRRSRDWTLNEEALEHFLTVLDRDRARAGERYERLRAKLTFMFERRGCRSPADLVDDSLDRAAHLLLDLEKRGEPVRELDGFVCRVAQLICHEDRRRADYRNDPIDSDHEFPARTAEVEAEAAERERVHKALTECLEYLAPAERSLVGEYYQGERRAKKEGRVRLAERLGITMNALSLRAFHIRRKLETCISERLAQPEFA